MNRLAFRATAGIVFTLVLAGCAAKQHRSASPEEIVGNRAQERWALIVSGDWKLAYSFLSAGVRDVTAYDSYEARLSASRVKWTEAKTESVTCDTTDRCVALVKVAFDLIGVVPGIPQLKSDQTVEEVWIRQADGWYFVPQWASR